MQNFKNSKAYVSSLLLVCFTLLYLPFGAHAAEVNPAVKMLVSRASAVWLKNELKTGDQGVKFEMKASHTMVEVAPHSEIKLQLEKGPEAIELTKGMARMHVEKATASASKVDPKFFLRTKSATMGVRGTDFLAIVTPVLGESEIVVFEGNVDFASAQDSTDLKQVTTGHWGGIGGRFGSKTHDLIELPKEALSYFEAASTVK